MLKLITIIPKLQEFVAWLRQEKRIKKLEDKIKEKDLKYEALMNRFNKHLQGQLIKSRGKK